MPPLPTVVLTRCEECPYALLCLGGTLYPHFLMVRICPRCGLTRFVKGDRKLDDSSADCDVAAKPFIYCCKRQITGRQRGAWKTACTKFLSSHGTGRVNDIRDTWVTVEDPEVPTAPHGMMVLLCDDCYALALQGAQVPKGMGTALPHEFYGWCPD